MSEFTEQALQEKRTELERQLAELQHALGNERSKVQGLERQLEKLRGQLPDALVNSDGKLHPLDICYDPDSDNPLGQNGRCVINDLKYRRDMLSDENKHLREALARTTGVTPFTALRRANLERQKLWEEGGMFDAAFYGLAMVSEAGEAGNVVKKLERERLGARGSRATVAQLAQEMADTVIYMDLLANHYGIDLWPAIVLTFNNVSEREGFNVKLL